MINKYRTHGSCMTHGSERANSRRDTRISEEGTLLENYYTDDHNTRTLYLIIAEINNMHTTMVDNRKVTTSGNYTIQNTELYAAQWADGAITWLEATSIKQATLLHTLLQKERPISVTKETQNGCW